MSNCGQAPIARFNRFSFWRSGFVFLAEKALQSRAESGNLQA